MKQYIVFSESNPTGELIESNQLYLYDGIDGQVYEIGPKVGELLDLAAESLEEREREEN